MIGHRGEDFRNLYRAVHPGLQTLFGTKQPVFLSTSSAWGVMEASIRNLADRGVLCCMCGAFSDKWFDVAKRCGKKAEPLQVDWGKHIDPKDIDRQLATGKFDTVTLIHNETSTGVMNPLEEICGVMARYPDVALVLDTVSSFSAVKIDMDELGIEIKARRNFRRRFGGALRSTRAHERAGARLGAPRRVRFLRPRRIPLKDAYLREKQQGYRCAGAREETPGETSSGD